MQRGLIKESLKWNMVMKTDLWEEFVSPSRHLPSSRRSRLVCHVTVPLRGEFTGDSQRPVTRSFDFFFIFAWMNNCEACDLWRHRAHYDVTVMISLTYKSSHSSFYIALRDDTMAWKRFPYYLPSTVKPISDRSISLAKSQWDGVLMFSLTLVWTSCWPNSRVSSDLRHHDTLFTSP